MKTIRATKVRTKMWMIVAASALLVSTPGCSQGQPVDEQPASKPDAKPAETGEVTLLCHEAAGAPRTYVLKINDVSGTAEFVVDVPEESIQIGVPAGNRKGTVNISERLYKIVIPADSGGDGEQRWGRMQFSFEIDRFTAQGTLEIGEARYGPTADYQLRCETGPSEPLL